MGSGGSNSGLRACMTSTLPTEQSPQAGLFLTVTLIGQSQGLNLTRWGSSTVPCVLPLILLLHGYVTPSQDQMTFPFAFERHFSGLWDSESYQQPSTAQLSAETAGTSAQLRCTIRLDCPEGSNSHYLLIRPSSPGKPSSLISLQQGGQGPDKQ